MDYGTESSFSFISVNLDQNTSNSSINGSEQCYYPPTHWIEIKFWFVAVCGTSIALLSVIENSLLLYMFLTRSEFRKTNLFFMLFLAFFDIIISVTYIMIMSVQVIMEYLESYVLHLAWHGYLRVTFTISHTAMAASTFLIIAATFERFLAVLQASTFTVQFNERKRATAVFIAITFGIIAKGCVYFELTLQTNPMCKGTRAEIWPVTTEITTNFWYGTVWMFYARHFGCIFIPFIILSYANYKIVIRLKRQNQSLSTIMLSMTMGSKRVSAAREQVRAATRMLVMIISAYLATNFLNVVVTVWEHINKDDLMYNHTMFYSLSVDVISFSTVAASASRLPIYWFCNSKVREKILGILNHCAHNFLSGMCNNKKEQFLLESGHKSSRLSTCYSKPRTLSILFRRLSKQTTLPLIGTSPTNGSCGNGVNHMGPLTDHVIKPEKKNVPNNCDSGILEHRNMVFENKNYGSIIFEKTMLLDEDVEVFYNCETFL